MRTLLLIAFCAIVLISTNCDNRETRIKSKRQTELKELLLEMKGEAKKDMRYSYPEARIADMNAYELIPDLIVLLRNKDPWVRISTARALSELGAKEAMPEIIKLLNDESPGVRTEAVEIIGQFRAKESISELLVLLKNAAKDPRKNTTIIGCVATILSKLGSKESAPILLELLNDKNVHKFDRPKIVFALARFDVKDAVSELKEKFSFHYPGIDESEHQVFIDKIDAKELTQKLMELLKNNGPSGYIINDLYKLNAMEVIPELRTLLQNGDPIVRLPVIWLLGKLGDKEVIPILKGLLHKEGNKNINTEIIFALARVGDKEVIPELINLIKNGNDEDKYGDIFRSTCNILEELNIKESIPELKRQLGNKSLPKYLRAEAGFVLVKFGVISIIPELIELTKRDDGYIENDYVLKFAHMGIKESIPELTRFLKHDSRFARIPAAIALVKLGEKKYITKDIIRDLQSCLYSKDIIYQNINARVSETLDILGVPVTDSKTPDELRRDREANPDKDKPVDGK